MGSDTIGTKETRRDAVRLNERIKIITELREGDREIGGGDE